MSAKSAISQGDSGPSAGRRRYPTLVVPRYAERRIGSMLQRNMAAGADRLQLSLDDVLGGLQLARRNGNLGRLALLAFCEVRRWARQAGEAELAQHSLELVTEQPQTTRAEFLRRVDELIDELQRVRARLLQPHESSGF